MFKPDASRWSVRYNVKKIIEQKVIETANQIMAKVRSISDDEELLSLISQYGK